MARDAGRDPSTLAMVVRANLEITEQALGQDRMIFTGTLDQIKEDVAACEKAGASEVFFDPAFSPEGNRWIVGSHCWKSFVPDTSGHFRNSANAFCRAVAKLLGNGLSDSPTPTPGIALAETAWMSC